MNRQPWLPTLPPPYVLVLVELEEQPDVRVLSQLVGVDPEAVRIGDEVEVFVEGLGTLTNTVASRGRS